MDINVQQYGTLMFRVPEVICLYFERLAEYLVCLLTDDDRVRIETCWG